MDASKTDLLVIGAGRLGGKVISGYRALFPNAGITAETRNGAPAVEPPVGWRRRDDPGPLPTARDVLFAVPPTLSGGYAAEAARAIAAWDGTGTALLVSSTAVYAEEDGGWVSETSVLDSSDRARRLLAAEREFLSRGGSVVRLAGLYSAERGPHLAYRRAPASAGRGNAWVNLIEEGDAARLCVRALEVGARGAIYLGCDGEPVTREALWSLVGDGRPSPFGGENRRRIKPLGGRRCANAWTRAELGWEPRYRRFADWWKRQPK